MASAKVGSPSNPAGANCDAPGVLERLAPGMHDGPAGDRFGVESGYRIGRLVLLHALAGLAAAAAAWMQGTDLRPLLAPLDPPEQVAFLEAYRGAPACAYPARPDVPAVPPGREAEARTFYKARSVFPKSPNRPTWPPAAVAGSRWSP